MTFLDRIRECNAHDLARYRALFAADRRVGHVRDDRVPALCEVPELVLATARGLELVGDTFAARTAALDALMMRMVARGFAPAACAERYPVADVVRGEPVCSVDRRHVAWLGIHAGGVHVNGFVRAADGLRMWIAHRARDKATYPGMLDNLVAGGQPIGLGLFDNVLKECGEEAGIPVSLAATARSVGAISYVYEDATGLKPDTMFCFDLELPDDFVPRPVDGEVERFECLPIAEVAALVADTRRFKFNCNLVVIDFLVRHGQFAADEPDYPAIVAGLHRPLAR